MRWNIRYDDEDSVDVIDVPERLGPEMEAIAQAFLDWIPPEDLFSEKNGWVLLNGEKVLSKNTDGFADWLNDRYCREGERAAITAREVPLDGQYGTLEF